MSLLAAAAPLHAHRLACDELSKHFPEKSFLCQEAFAFTVLILRYLLTFVKTSILNLLIKIVKIIMRFFNIS